MQKAKPLLSVVLFLVVGCLVIAATWFLADRLAPKKHDDHNVQTVSCSAKGKEYTATIQNDKMTPDNIRAKLCDTLTIINKDSKERDVAFGEHDHHQTYDGVRQKMLQKDEQLSVTLNQAGTFKFHDHLQDEVAGHITVNK